MTTTQKYTKRPVTIDAMEFPGEGNSPWNLTSWLNNNRYVWLVGDATRPETLRYHDQSPLDDSRPDKGIYINPATGALVIRTLEGDMQVSPGDFVIKGVENEFYAVKPDIFHKTYEKA